MRREVAGYGVGTQRRPQIELSGGQAGHEGVADLLWVNGVRRLSRRTHPAIMAAGTLLREGDAGLDRRSEHGRIDDPRQAPDDQ